MKIKADFVTNSSSTAYVVFVPNNFYADEEEIKKLYNDEYKEYETLTDEQLFKNLPDCIELLKEGDNVWSYGSEGITTNIWNMTVDICRHHDLVLSSLEMNGEGNNIIQGVKEEQIEKIFMTNIDIMSTFNMIQRSQNVTTKTE